MVRTDKELADNMHLVLITDRFDEEIGRLTGLGATPVNEVNLPAVRLGGDLYVVHRTTFADLEGNEFDLVMWQQQAE